MKQTRRSILIFMAPAVILMLSVFFYPAVRTTAMSFFGVPRVTTPMSDWTFKGLQNFIDLFNTPLFVTSLLNILKIWVFCGIATIILSLVFAVAFTTQLRFKKFFRAIVYLPNVIAAIAIGYMWLLYVYNSNFGLLHNLFAKLGWQSMAEFGWLSTDHVFLSMCIANVFGNVGYFMMMYIAGIEKIPVDYYEASRIEGANVFQQFRCITLPLIKGVFATSAVLWTTRTVGFFALSQVFKGVQTYTPMLFTYETLFGTEFTVDINAGTAAAAAVVMTVTVVIISSLINHCIKDEAYEL